jgi:hypothetical protein
MPGAPPGRAHPAMTSTTRTGTHRMATADRMSMRRARDLAGSARVRERVDGARTGVVDASVIVIGCRESEQSPRLERTCHDNGVDVPR